MSRRTEAFEANAKTSSVVRIDARPSPSRIAQAKSLEIQEEETKNRIINSIRESIVQEAIETLRANYLENRSYSFVVDCAHAAWVQLFDWMYLKCNAGLTSKSFEERWTGDEEPKTVPKDNWVCGNVPVRKKSTHSVETEICEAVCSQADVTDVLPRNITVPSIRQFFEVDIEATADKIVRTESAEEPTQPVIAEASDEDGRPVEGESEAVAAAAAVAETDDVEDGESDRSEVLSIFTRTISMPRHKLPITRSSSDRSHPTVRSSDACREKTRRSWRLDSVRPPRKLSVERLPASRVDIKYALMADSRGSSNAGKDVKRRASSSKTLSRDSGSFKPRRDSGKTSQP